MNSFRFPSDFGTLESDYSNLMNMSMGWLMARLMNEHCWCSLLHSVTELQCIQWIHQNMFTLDESRSFGSSPLRFPWTLGAPMRTAYPAIRTTILRIVSCWCNRLRTRRLRALSMDTLRLATSPAGHCCDTPSCGYPHAGDLSLMAPSNFSVHNES